jgi:uncharacterized protein with HEPN domain
MEPELRVWLTDVLGAIGELEECRGRCADFAAFRNERILQRASERCISIIGEAVNRIIKADPDVAISDVRKIISTRHKIVHDYEKVSADVLWVIIERHIPILKAEVQALLNQASS